MSTLYFEYPYILATKVSEQRILPEKCKKELLIWNFYGNIKA